MEWNGGTVIQTDRDPEAERKSDTMLIFFQLFLLLFFSFFSFPLLRFPPHYISQHIIGLILCECVCVCLEPWDEVCGYPLVWPGTQGHLILSLCHFLLHLVQCNVGDLQRSSEFCENSHDWTLWEKNFPLQITLYYLQTTLQLIRTEVLLTFGGILLFGRASHRACHVTLIGNI